MGLEDHQRNDGLPGNRHRQPEVAFDPELIVLGGGVSRSAEILIDPILRRMEGAIPTLPKLVVSSWA